MAKYLVYLLIICIFILDFSLVSGVSSISYNFNNSINNQQFFSSSQIITSNSAVVNIITEKKSSCKYSSVSGINYDLMEGNFDYNFDLIHKENLLNLADGSYLIYIVCRDQNGSDSGELEFKFNVNLPNTVQISFDKETPLDSGLVQIKLTSSKILAEAPSLSYSFDGTDYKPIPLSGNGNSWTGYINILPSLGEVAGSFKYSGRDLEGVVGSEIKSGAIFLVDTINPKEVIDINIIGGDGYIELEWFYDEEVKNYNIYRSSSPSVSQTNFYKNSNEDSIKDNNLERGKTYYYKVSAVDEAGNEGELSREVYATVLLSEYTSSASGLSAELLSYADNYLSQIDGILSNINSIKANFLSKGETEIKLYGYLKLERDLTNAQTELNSLRSEISRYKEQSLTKSDLEKKLSSADLKINAIIKKIPENLIISSQKTQSNEVSENDIAEVLFESYPEYSEEKINKIVRKSIEIIDNYDINIHNSIYNLEVGYLDGSRKSIALVKKEISFDNLDDNNVSFLEYIPKGIAESISEIDIKNINYNIVKEDTIIKFNMDENEIIYSLNKHIDLNSISQLKTIPNYKVEEINENNNFLTGYATLMDFKNNYYASGFIFVFFVFLIGSYLFISRRNNISLKNISEVIKLISEVKKSIENKNYNQAKDHYKEAALLYSKLTKKDRDNIYNKLEEAYQELNLNYFEYIYSQAVIEDNASARDKLINVLTQCYGCLNESNKEKNKEKIDQFTKNG